MVPGPWSGYHHSPVEDGLDSVERRLIDKRLEVAEHRHSSADLDSPDVGGVAEHVRNGLRLNHVALSTAKTGRRDTRQDLLFRVVACREVFECLLDDGCALGIGDQAA
jgi:hypothetical protein